MKPFIHPDFLLRSATARRLFHQHAANLPIIDYHCHLDPAVLAGDRMFENLTRLWIASDPYKHRAMRIAGVPETLITGPATDREKFDAWAATVPLTLGNPLHHWTALELKRYFDIDELLSPASADRIWTSANALLASADFSAQKLISRCNVRCVCTSDRLLDDLTGHDRLAQSSFAARVLPSLRSDDIVAIDQADYPSWIEKLGTGANVSVKSFADFQAAVLQRLDHFNQRGCRLADHALDDFVYVSATPEQTARLFDRCIKGESLASDETVRLKSGLLRFLGLEYAKRNWILQLHIGAQRRTSTRLRTLAGPAGGYSGIGPSCDIPSLCAFLDDLERRELLPRTILYTLNPADNQALAVLTGSFAQDGVPGKIQFGPAWWYNDHDLGIRRHLHTIANYGLLSAFVGMTTDSRSLLSMTRHEYFRRVMCDLLGQWVESGVFPSDEPSIAQLIRNIAYENPRRWILADQP